MPKQSQLDKAIEKIDQDIAVLQLTRKRLEEQRPRKSTSRTKSIGNPAEA